VHKARVKTLEKLLRLNRVEARPRVFVHYVPCRVRTGEQPAGSPDWTEEERAAAIRENPEAACFYKHTDGRITAGLPATKTPTIT
jgi:hypothetical protein